MVYTPVGARCRECAQVKRLPTYNLGTQTLVLAGLCAQHLLLLWVVSYRFWGMGGCDRRYLWLYPVSVLLVTLILLTLDHPSSSLQNARTASGLKMWTATSSSTAMPA